MLQLQKGTNTWHHKPVLGPAAKQYYYDWMRIWVVGSGGEPIGLSRSGNKSHSASCQQRGNQSDDTTCRTVTSQRESGPTRTMKTTTRNKQTKMGGNPPASCREAPAAGGQ